MYNLYIVKIGQYGCRSKAFQVGIFMFLEAFPSKEKVVYIPLGVSPFPEHGNHVPYPWGHIPM